MFSLPQNVLPVMKGACVLHHTWGIKKVSPLSQNSMNLYPNHGQCRSVPRVEKHTFSLVFVYSDGFSFWESGLPGHDRSITSFINRMMDSFQLFTWCYSTFNTRGSSILWRILTCYVIVLYRGPNGWLLIAVQYWLLLTFTLICVRKMPYKKCLWGAWQASILEVYPQDINNPDT